MNRIIFIICLLIVFINNISFTTIIISPIYFGWTVNFMYIVGTIAFLPLFYKNANKVEWSYFLVMFLGLIFHSFLQNSELYTINDSYKWIFIVLIIVIYKSYKIDNLGFYLILAFFVINSFLAIYENYLQQQLFDYKLVEKFENFTDSTEFRSFGLMGHPLFSANISVIILSFIIINEHINKYLKLSLIIIGTLALLSFNSRIAIIIWGCLLVYRYLLYNIKPAYIIVLWIFIYTLFINDFISLILQNSNIFGRLSEKNNLLDDSALSRVLSFGYFWSAEWNLKNIILGGRILYIPGTEVSLENGILLTISWWGWLVGTIKVILELVISYSCLRRYNIKDKAIIMIACWLIAFANNNSFQTFVFVFFVLTYISFDSFTRNKLKKQSVSFIYNNRKYFINYNLWKTKKRVS